MFFIFVKQTTYIWLVLRRMDNKITVQHWSNAKYTNYRTTCVNSFYSLTGNAMTNQSIYEPREVTTPDTNGLFLCFYRHHGHLKPSDETRRDKTRQDETRRDETRQDETRQDEMLFL